MGNSCGTTSLSWCLDQMGMFIPPGEIDRHIRQGDTYTAIDGLIDFSRGLGLQAQSYVNGDFATLQRELAMGRQVMVITSVDDYDAAGDLRTGGSDSGMHVMAVRRAYVQDGEPRVEFFNPWGTIEDLSYEQFEKLWSHVHEGKMPTGINRMYVSLARPDAPQLPPSNMHSVTTAMALSNGVSDIVNGWSHLRSGNLIQGAGEIVGGALQTLGGAMGAPFYGAGIYLQQGGRQMWDHAGEMLRSPGVFNKVGGAALGAAGAIVSGLGTAARTMGNIISTPLNAAGDFVEDATRAAANVVRDVGNAARRLWKKIF